MEQKGEHEHAEWRNAPRLIRTQAQGNPKGFVRRHGNLTQVGVPGSGHHLFGRPFPGYDPQQQLKHRNGNAGMRKS
ncbi:hypothetical protein ABZ543_17830 [Streptomyces roseifaciens]